MAVAALKTNPVVSGLAPRVPPEVEPFFHGVGFAVAVVGPQGFVVRGPEVLLLERHQRNAPGISTPLSGEPPVGTGYSSRVSLLSRCSEPGFLLSPGVGAPAGIVTPLSFVVTGARFGAS